LDVPDHGDAGAEIAHANVDTGTGSEFATVTATLELVASTLFKTSRATTNSVV
jgi:hypothetical protein